MIFVTDAGGKASSAFCSKSIFPVDASINIPLFASMVKDCSAEIFRAPSGSNMVSIKITDIIRFFIKITSLIIMKRGDLICLLNYFLTPNL